MAVNRQVTLEISSKICQFLVIKRERELRGPSPGIIDLSQSSDEGDNPGFDLSEGLTQPGDDLPLTTVIAGNLEKQGSSDENSSSQDLFDPDKPSTSTQIAAANRTLSRKESVKRIFLSDDSSSEDESNSTIKQEENDPEEGSYSPLSQELCKNENDSSDEPEEVDLDQTRAHSQNLFETSDIWSHFNDENYPTRYH